MPRAASYTYSYLIAHLERVELNHRDIARLTGAGKFAATANKGGAGNGRRVFHSEPGGR